MTLEFKNLYTSIGMLIVGCLSYLLSIESDFALAFFSLLTLSLISYFLVSELKKLKEGRNYATAIVLLGIFIWYLYPAFIYSFFLDKKLYEVKLGTDIGYEDLYKSLFLITIFSSSFVFFSGVSNENSKSLVIPLNERSNRIILIATFASILGMLPILSSGFSVSQILELLMIGRGADKPWVHSENIGNQTSGFIYILRCFSYAGVMLILTYLFNIKDVAYKKLLISLLGVFILLVLSIDSGTRSLSMLVVLPCLTVVLHSKIRDENSLLIMLRFIMLVLFLVLLLQIQLIFRDEFTQDKDFWELFSNDILLLGGTIDYYVETVYSVLLVPGRHEYFLEFDLVYFTTFPIPRFIWENKPVSEIVWFYTMERWGVNIFNEGGNIFPGLVGQYYMSMGYIGPLVIGAVYAFICNSLNKRIYNALNVKAIYHCSLYMMYGFWLFVSFRFFSPGFLFPVLMSHLILIISKLSFRRTGTRAY